MTIAITGATGLLGRLVINQLKGQVPAARPVENRPSESSLPQKEERVSLDDIARQAQPTPLHPQHGVHHHE
jgi:aspartate-semialdehyde dehydrogenase